jgi:hypothetical protein
VAVLLAAAVLVAIAREQLPLTLLFHTQSLLAQEVLAALQAEE